MGNLVKSEPVYIFACPNPFTSERKRIEIRPELRISLAEIIADLQPNRIYRKNAHVFVNGERIKEEDWAYFYPAPGSLVDIRVVPRAVVAAIVISIAAALAGAATTYALGGTLAAMLIGSLVATAISIVGYLVISAFVRPPKKSTPALTKEDSKETPSYYLSGSRNSASPYGVIPRVYGKIRMTPPLAALPYTELMNKTTVPLWVGNSETTYATKYREQGGAYLWLHEWLGEDQYMRMAVCWGYGPLSISNLRIGETAIEYYYPYWIEHRYGYPEDEPLTLYTDDVYEESLSVALTFGASVIRTTQDHCDEISIDIAFDGLYTINKEYGQKGQVAVIFLVQYRQVGSGPGGWITAAQQFNCSGARMGAIRRGLRWRTDGGQYDVMITRSTPEAIDEQYEKSSSYWSALRTVTYTKPVNERGVAISALYVKATDQLQGAIDELNGLVTSILYDWDANMGEWVIRETNNPASIIRDILLGNPEYGISANSRPLSEDRVHMESLQDFHTWCEQKGFTCNMIVDSETSVWELLQLVAATGRATMAMIDGKWGIAIDREQDVPVQHFTQRNSWDFQATQTFIEEIHGFRVKFLNEEEDYAETETTVYMNGYDEHNATLFEELRLDGITNYNQIYKLARYFLAVAEHRREMVTFTTDLEHIVCQRGDRIKFSHDVMLLGIQSGRLRGTTVSGSTYTHITIDEAVPMIGGTDYNIRFRLDDGTSMLMNIVASSGTFTTLELETPVNVSSTFPSVGDLYTFGEAGTETEDFIVKNIDPGADLSATLECTLYSPVVFTADAGPIPPYVPKITYPLDWQIPTVSTIYSDGSVLIWSQGSWQSRVLVTFSFPKFMPTYEKLEGWFRKTAESAGEDAGAWTVVEASIAERELSLVPVEDGALYEMKFRYIKQGGSRGPWTSLVTHTVLGKTDPPSDVTGFSGAFFNGMTSFKWNKVPDVDVSGYEIRYGSAGCTWDSATVLVQTLSSTLAVAVLMPTGTWDALIKAIDVVGNYSDNAARAQVVVTTTYQIVFTQSNAGWPGSLTNYVENHRTGHLNPQSTIIATATDIFSSYVPSPFTYSIYTGATIDLGGTDTVIAYASVQGALGVGEPGVINPDIQMNALQGTAFTGWIDFSSGAIECSQIRFRFTSSNSVGLYAVSAFECMLAKEQVIETRSTSIASLGAWVIFTNKFYNVPYLQVSGEAVSGAPRIASYATISTTGFVGYIHTTSGTDVGGTLTYTATSRGES